jgi:hypothetical protein
MNLLFQHVLVLCGASGWHLVKNSLALIPDLETPVPYGDLHAVSPFVATPQAAIDTILNHLKVIAATYFLFLEKIGWHTY